jgi:hypothetical protein
MSAQIYGHDKNDENIPSELEKTEEATLAQ